MFEIFLISIGLVLIIEGVFYFFLANNLKKYLNTETMNLSSGEVKKLELLRLILEQKKNMDIRWAI